jgi:hypothetical protein
MEYAYYQEWVDASNELEIAKAKIVELKKNEQELLKKLGEYRGVIKGLRKSLSDTINEIVELTTTPEEDCPCGENCSCKGDNDIETDV